MAYQDSAQTFVRALRAPTDPPRQGDPSKIDIASAAWRETTFHVPRKSEVILEWCLTRLLKDGTRHSESNPVLDLRFWTLLQDILLFLNPENSKPRSVHNTWLVPLLNRVPLLPILLSLLSNSLDLAVQKRDELYLYSSKCLALVWSLAAPKFSPDSLLECFGAVLRVLTQEGSGENSGLNTVCTLVTISLRYVLSHSLNKRKFSQAFMTKHIDAWLNFVSDERAACSHTYKEICDMGIELLFNVDNLKPIAEAPRTNPLVEALRAHISSSQPQLLSTLPFLMTAFTTAVKKRRSLLPSGIASTADTLATWFFSSCEEILHAVGDLHGNQVWRSRLGLLRTVQDESLFSPRNENMATLLQEEVGACVECLVAVDGENIQIAIQCLCVLARIDYDLVEASTDLILPKFLTTHQSPHGKLMENYAHEFLSLSLSFRSKTRTLPVHISHLIDSCIRLPPHFSSLSIRASYDGLVASPALTPNHLNKLSMAVRTFITPGQTLDTARRVLDVLRGIWEHFRDMEKVVAADRGRGPRKKRRISDSSSNTGKGDSDIGAVTFMLAARITTTVLISLPLHTITEAEQAQVKTAVAESLTGFVREAILAGTGTIISGSSDREADAWAPQVVAAAALRFSYMLQMSGQAPYGENDQSDLGELATACLKVDDCLPEYNVEIFRYLLQHKSYRDSHQQQILLDAILNFLEAHLPVNSPAPGVWSGRSSQLSFDEDGHALAAIALLRLLLERNLEVINAYGSQKQLERLVKLLHLACVELEPEYTERGLSFATTVHECLHSANFWEQENIRSSFFAVQHARSAFLDDTVDVTNLWKKTKKRSSSHLSENQLREVVKAYTLLLYPSSECIPKFSRGDFLRRAVVLDMLLGSRVDASTRAFQVVRTFLTRTLSLLGSWEHEGGGQYLHYLMTSPVPTSTEQVTMHLVQGHLRAAFRAAIQGSADAVIDAVQICRTQPLGDWLLSKDSSMPFRGSAQVLIDVAMDDFSLSSFPPDLVEHMSSLFEHVFDQLHPIISRLASHDVTERAEVLQHSDILLLWGRAITLGRHLKHIKTPSPGLGSQILQAVGPLLLPWNSKDSKLFAFCDAIHAVLVSELQSFSKEEEREDRESHLQRIVTTYMFFAPLSMSVERYNLDENMAKLFRTLSPSEFSSCLQFVIEALSPNGIASDDFARLVRLISLALLNAPENTLKIVQAYVKECLDVFVDDEKLCNDHVLRLPMLTLISDLCSKRAALIRPQNVVSIWVLLSRLLAGTKEAHDPKTNTAVFHEIVTIVGSLVRLRRDLVVTTLPHLINIIRRLLFALRHPRPLLGGKQYAIVAESFPVWVNPSYPLGAEESKGLSRLLTSLSVKTSVRVHGPSAEPQKQESLARPLSKHVACAIQAYLEVLNDPLCILPADIRRDLQPGLFVLCDMLNDHTRDALMVSALDASGKAALKSLWREYEKQRYTGKG